MKEKIQFFVIIIFLVVAWHGYFTNGFVEYSKTHSREHLGRILEMTYRFDALILPKPDDNIEPYTLRKEKELLASSINSMVTAENTKSSVLLTLLFIKFTILQGNKRFCEGSDLTEVEERTEQSTEQWEKTGTSRMAAAQKVYDNRMQCLRLRRLLQDSGDIIPTNAIIQALSPKVEYLSNRTDGGININIDERYLNDLKLCFHKFEKSILKGSYVAVVNSSDNMGIVVPTYYRSGEYDTDSEDKLVKIFSKMLFGSVGSSFPKNYFNTVLEQASDISCSLKVTGTTSPGDFYNGTLFDEPIGTFAEEWQKSIQRETFLGILLRSVETKIFRDITGELPPYYLNWLLRIKKAISEEEMGLELDVACDGENGDEFLILKKFVSDFLAT